MSFLSLSLTCCFLAKAGLFGSLGLCIQDHSSILASRPASVKEMTLSSRVGWSFRCKTGEQINTETDLRTGFAVRQHDGHRQAVGD